MLMSHEELVEEIYEAEVLKRVDPKNINGTSIDIRLGNSILVEDYPDLICPSCGHNTKQTAYEYTHGLRVGLVIVCSQCDHAGLWNQFVIPVDFSKKEAIKMRKVDISKEPYVLMPGEVCLAHTVEEFHLPMHITAEYRLKSSQARVFLEHLHAVWCDPGWNNAVLTLEFANMTRYHPLLLRGGEKGGQVMFYRHKPVPKKNSYAVNGQYNGDQTATQTKGSK